METLTTYIDRLVEDEVERILREARERVEARLERASRELKRLESQALERAQRIIRVEEARQEALVRRKVKAQILGMEHAIARQCVEIAKGQVYAAYQKKRERLLPRLVQEILSLRRGGEPVVLHVNPEDYPLLQRSLKDENVSVLADPSVKGGVIGEFTSRGLRVANTLESRMDRAKEVLLERFYQILLPDTQGDSIAH